MIRAPLGILVPGHDQRWNAAAVSIAMVWSICVIRGGLPGAQVSPCGAVVGCS